MSWFPNLKNIIDRTICSNILCCAVFLYLGEYIATWIVGSLTLALLLYLKYTEVN